MDLPIAPPYPAMEARTVDVLPMGERWQYEPKWDGFRCLAFRDGDEVRLQSKGLRPLGRYFPDIVAALKALRPKRFVLDGELIVPVDGNVSFEELQLRLHPAASRVAKLAAAHPAQLLVFDLLVDDRSRLLADVPLVRRRSALEAFAGKFFSGSEAILLSPATASADEARSWFDTTGGGLDGVIAKRLDEPYRGGERDGMVKIKHIRTADCVVGGFRYGTRSRQVGSLLLGLYDLQGLLDHVGFTSTIEAGQKGELTHRLEQLRKRGVKQAGFTGRSPGGPSRWSTERSGEFESLPHELVVEVAFDHFSGGRFRHGTRLLRWRPDKAPHQCTMEQLELAKGSSLKLLEQP